jgi:AbrB family looped-hinge helix DNA binding protein
MASLPLLARMVSYAADCLYPVLTSKQQFVEYKYMNIREKRYTEERRGMPTVKLGTSRQIVIPKKLYDELGLEAGDYLEVELYEGGKLLVTPKELVDQHPEIDNRLAEAEADLRAGRVKGPFKTAHETVEALRSASRRKK